MTHGSWTVSLLAALCLPAPAIRAGPPVQQTPSRPRARDEAATQRVQRLWKLEAEHDWTALLREARELRSDVPVGSDAWFEAQLAIVHGQWSVWNPERAESVARRMLEVATELRLSRPDDRKSGIGPLHPAVARTVVDAELHLARVLQSRGRHAEALGHLDLALDDLKRGPVDAAAALAAEGHYDAGLSLLAIGRFDDARGALRSVALNAGDRKQVPLAVAALMGLPGVEDPYRGEFADDDAHARLRAEVRAGIPTARRRVAEQLGWEVADVPAVRIAVADTPPSLDGIGAFTDYDWRRPDFPPTVVVFAEGLARGVVDVGSVLVHELTHAALLARLGATYEEAPPWFGEGIVFALCDEFESRAVGFLELLLLEDAERYSKGSLWDERGLDFGIAESGRTVTREAPFLILPLAELWDGTGARLLVDELIAGASLDEAFRALTGKFLADYEVDAEEAVRTALEDRRAVSHHAIRVLEVTRKEGVRTAAHFAEQLLLADLPPEAEGWAMVTHAEALYGLRRFAEADAAWRALLDLRPRHAPLVELAFLGRARCLEKLDRGDEARALLVELRRASTETYMREKLAERIAELENEAEER